MANRQRCGLGSDGGETKTEELGGKASTPISRHHRQLCWVGCSGSSKGANKPSLVESI